MATSWGLTGDDLAQWARKYDAPGVLPELVRRLILATAPVSAVTMSSHSGTRLPGWDGEVRASAETPFCPAGRSFWELTVEDNKAKLTQDFRKRSALATREATYVAVSAGRVVGHTRWAQDRAAEGMWRDVRLIHADDLAAWLATAPAVARWFGRIIGLSRSDGTDVGTFLDGWRARTQIRLPIEIAIAGEQRQRHAESIRAWARTAGATSRPLRVYGDTWDEAAVFAAAALALDPSLEGSQVLARTVVAETPDALRSVGREQQAEATVAIAAFPGAISDLGPVILTLVGPAPEGAPAIELSPAPHLRFAEILANAGMPIDRADRYARQSAGKLSALQRLLGYVAPPPWATGAPQVPIAIMLLVGAFEPNNPDDREAIALLGGEPAEVELLCEQLRLSSDAPTVKEQGRTGRSVWRWRAPDDAWKALVGRVPASVLRTFPAVATRILAERDPGFDLPKDQRFAAALYGKSLRVSEHLRQGIARSLARLAQSNEALQILHGPQRGSMVASSVVHDVLPTEWMSWASLSRLLPLLAEAAPVPFMEALEASLHAPSSGAAQLLRQEVSTGASPHVGLLWALETLGWNADLMPRVAAALADLAQHDVDGHLPGKLVNRPAHSLEKLLRLALWQTNADAGARISEFKRRLREDQTATVGFPLLVRQLATVGAGGLVDQARRPEIWPEPIPSHDDQVSLTNEQFEVLLSAYVDLAIEYSDTNAERWSYLIEHGRVQSELGPRFLERLEAIAIDIHDSGGKMWAALRRALHTMGAREDDNATWKRWEALYHRFTPADLILRHSWLFAVQVTLPEPFNKIGDLAEHWKRIEQLRLDAVEAIVGSDEQSRLLVRLAESSEDKVALGGALGRSSIATALESQLVDSSASPALVPVVPGFLIARSTDPAWLTGKLRLMLQAGRTAEVRTTLLSWGASVVVWDIVDGLGDDIRDAYWRGLRRLLGPQSTEAWDRAIGHLIRVGNVAVAALTVGFFAKDIHASTIATVLTRLLDEPQESKTFFRDPSASYLLEQIITRLESEPDASTRYDTILTRTELVYAVGTREPTRPLRRLSAAFAARPADFVELVKRIYRSDTEAEASSSTDDDPEAQEDRAAGAESAYRILEAWRGYPGEGLPDSERDASLLDWSTSALRALVIAGRSDVGASEVARVLARAGRAEADNTWPCVAARKLLESGEFPALSRALAIAQLNRRGATTRSLGEGGRQEREAAQALRNDARGLREEWPRTADMLDSLAGSYESDASRQDAQAATTLRDEGAEPADFGRPPPLVRGLPSPKRRIVSPGLVRVSRIDLANFALLEQLTLPLTPPADRGQWLLLLGENGKCKSTLLRAVALALAGSNVAQGVLGTYPTSLIRGGQRAARCAVTLDERTYTVSLSNEAGAGDVATCEPPDAPRPLVFGYGCRRAAGGASEGGADLDRPSSDVATLFDDSAQLYPARTWLKELKLRALQDPAYDETFTTVSETLPRQLLPGVEKLDVADNQVWAIAPALGGRVPLEALSDGYTMTLAWTVDLIARWARWAELLERKPPEGNFFERMQGLVLIDELDLHLHPSWQRNIITVLRNLFPRISFIATTHNPLTLLGTEPGEVFVLRAGSESEFRLEARRVDVPRGLRADRILTGEWFGLPYAIDDDTIALVELHQQMLLNGVPEDAPDRRRVEDELAQRYGSYADSSIDLAAKQVAAELKREMGPATPEDRSELRERLRARVRERLRGPKRN